MADLQRGWEQMYNALTHLIPDEFDHVAVGTGEGKVPRICVLAADGVYEIDWAGVDNSSTGTHIRRLATDGSSVIEADARIIDANGYLSGDVTWTFTIALRDPLLLSSKFNDHRGSSDSFGFAHALAARLGWVLPRAANQPT